MAKTTPRFHPKNERIKQIYFRYLKEADQKATSTIDGIRKAILRYEGNTGRKDFKTFNSDQAIAFKKHLSNTKALRTGEPISKATMLTTTNALQTFFKWLAYQPGYKSKIHVPDIKYLSMSEKDTRIAKAPKFKDFPTLEQVRKAIFSMPVTTEIEQRDRALIAIAISTGMRDGAIASLSLKHLDITRNPVLVMQEPGEVDTKFSKRIDTFFFPVGDDIWDIVLEWIRYLRIEKAYGMSDPVFPRTQIGQNENNLFEAQGLEPVHWSTTSSIRKAFRKAYENAGIRYFNPHLFRDTLTHFGMEICKTPEEFKAWSQNLGHEDVMTTIGNYGGISTHRQGEVLKGLSAPNEEVDKFDQILQAIKARN